MRTSLTFKYVQWGDYEFKVTAENRAGTTDSNVAYGTLWTSKRSLLYLMTLNTDSSRNMFWQARNTLDHYGVYNFNWSTDLCSRPGPDQPPVWGWGPIFGFKRVDFRPPCTRHDFSYRNYPDVGWTSASKRHHLDTVFYAEMRRECDIQLDWRYNANCYLVAHTYWSAVRMRGHF
ncbi:phospholipase A2 [Nonomuraea sp. NPDC003709]|uniref:phospholipase A2 n=1 Tax=Nonomuraea sp. NPDC003709 TaxID=3154450 RepID=UPI0033AD41B7